jgi:D-alanine-D-alanine ligase
VKVLILHTLPPETMDVGRERGEFDLSAAVRAIADVLPHAIVCGVRGEPQELIDVLARQTPDAVFNACEAPLGRSDLEAHGAALFEWLNVPFTGCGSEALALCRRKDVTNAVLSAAGVPIPRSDRLPCIVKPAAEDASVGIRADSVCNDAFARARARARIAGPVVVQEFLTGREFPVSMWGPQDAEWAAIGEVDFINGLQLITYAAKWDPHSADFANSPVRYNTTIEPALERAILASARGAWHALGLRGYARVDVRLNAEGVPCVLDVNPNPDLTPGGGMHRAVLESGWTWERFVRTQIEWALSSAAC